MSEAVLICPFCDSEVGHITPGSCPSCGAIIKVRGRIQDSVHKEFLPVVIVGIIVLTFQVALGEVWFALAFSILLVLFGVWQYWRWHYKVGSPDDIRFTWI